MVHVRTVVDTDTDFCSSICINQEDPKERNHQVKKLAGQREDTSVGHLLVGDCDVADVEMMPGRTGLKISAGDSPETSGAENVLKSFVEFHLV